MTTEAIELGSEEIWKTFGLLVLVNALVGGMVGLEGEYPAGDC